MVESRAGHLEQSGGIYVLKSLYSYTRTSHQRLRKYAKDKLPQISISISISNITAAGADDREFIYIYIYIFVWGGGVCVVAFVCDRSALKKNKSKAESKQKQNNIAAEEKMEEKGPRKPRDVLIFSRNFSRLHRYLSDYG